MINILIGKKTIRIKNKTAVSVFSGWSSLWMLNGLADLLLLDETLLESAELALEIGQNGKVLAYDRVEPLGVLFSVVVDDFYRVLVDLLVLLHPAVVVAYEVRVSLEHLLFHVLQLG